jgi:hypothetical protein
MSTSKTPNGFPYTRFVPSENQRLTFAKLAEAHARRQPLQRTASPFRSLGYLQHPEDYLSALISPKKTKKSSEVSRTLWLCEQCERFASGLINEEFLNWNRDRRHNFYHDPTQHYEYEHGGYQEVQRTANLGCVYCAFFLEFVTSDLREEQKLCLDLRHKCRPGTRRERMFKFEAEWNVNHNPYGENGGANVELFQHANELHISTPMSEQACAKWHLPYQLSATPEAPWCLSLVKA